jgi:hypothetical protein
VDVNEFAQLILAQTRERLAAAYSQEQADRETVQVRPGPKYTKVDIGPEHNISGKYMIENATGVIYGIKGYGQVHKGHTYGTLDTADQWYWGGYTGERRPQPQPETEAARERRVDAGLEQHRQDAHGGGLCDCARKAEGRDIKHQPVNPELFRRTAPRWNCVDYPGEGMHYLTPGGCAWCAMTREQIDAERAAAGHSCPHCGCSTDQPVSDLTRMIERVGPPDQQPGGPGPYTHIVRRDSGYVAGYFRGEPPADFIAECNANVPGDPAHAEELSDEWPESFIDEMRSDPSTRPVTGAPLPDVDARRAETARMRDGTQTRHEIDSLPQSEGNPYTAYTPESRVFEIAQRHGARAAEEAMLGMLPDQAAYRELISRIPELRSRPGASVSEPKLRWDDLPGYAVADLMSQAGWVPHDGTMLRDELASQYESQARIAFWNGVEQAALREFRGHKVVENTTQLGNRFMTCACGHRTSGGVSDDIAQRNMDYHIETVQKLRRQATAAE